MAEPIGPKKHSLLDHMMGADGVHVHGEGEDFDHDHDHDDFGEYDPEHDSLWLADHIQLLHRLLAGYLVYIDRQVTEEKADKAGSSRPGN